MSKKKPPTPPPHDSHPYMVKFSLALGRNVEVFPGEADTRCSFADSHHIRIIKDGDSPRDQASYIKRFSIELEAFESACEAELAGNALAASLLWITVSKRVSLTFDRWTGSFPFAVQNRTQSNRGLPSPQEVRVFAPMKHEEFFAIAEKAFKTRVEVTDSLLASMEFYASAQMETTQRTRFISMMTALEALSIQEDYGEELGETLKGLAKQLESSPLLAGPENKSMRESLCERLKQLKRESVRRAIRRTVSEHINGGDLSQTQNFLEDAYDARTRYSTMASKCRTSTK